MLHLSSQRSTLQRYARQAQDALAKVDDCTAATTLEPGATATGASQKLDLLDNQAGRCRSRFQSGGRL